MLGYYFRKYKVQSAIILFTISYVLVMMMQPRFCFDNEGNVLQFGLNYKNKTIVPIWLVSILLAIFSYFMIYYYLHVSSIIF